MYKFSILIIACILFGYGCAGIPVYRLHSLENDNNYFKGIESASKADSNAEVILQFQSQSGGNYIFHLSVINKSSEQYLFNPADIYSEPVSYDNKSWSRTYSIDPEHQLKDIDHELNKTVSKKKASDVVNTFVGFLGIASAIADIGKQESDEELKQEEDAREDFQQSIVNEDIAYNNKMNELNNSKHYWENEILRTSTLYSNDEIDGSFYMPIIPEAKTVKVAVPVNGKDYEFLFEQTCSNNY